MTRWEPPAAGREPAAAAVLGWLADPKAPPLCLVSGSAGCGKSTLLAWLVRHGSRSATPGERAIHAVSPFAGSSARGTVWALAAQLGLSARAPGELVAQLAADTRRAAIVIPDLAERAVAELVLELARLPHVRLIVEARTGSPAHGVLAGNGYAELDLDLAQWQDTRRFEQWQAALPPRGEADAGAGAADPVDLSSPEAVCAADPWVVTALYEADAAEDHGGLRSSWLKAGQSLCREQTPAARALVLLAALGDMADPRLRPALAGLAEEAPWQVDWTLTKGDVAPPWTGPVAALTLGEGSLDGTVLAADHLGTVRILTLCDGVPQGRLSPAVGVVSALAVLLDGTLLVLGEAGGVHADRSGAQKKSGSGMEALLEGPDEADGLITSLQGQAGTALASAGDVVALGDALGTVRVSGEAVARAALHDGPVSAVAVVSLPVDDGTMLPVVYSGGVDGKVRAWSPLEDPMRLPVVERRQSVVALDAAYGDEGPLVAVAWADGLVELHQPDTGGHLRFRPGAPVRAVAVTTQGSVVVGMDETVVRLSPRIRQPTTL
ncbi:hypothetical protein HRW07_04745 [Streptomyces lunaelactis]|uniref:hypothetical protein n=1 Tax=Streptomyces lunaelactis TaxID=1535768 RepID=UPI001585130F|nr:hypothetical protein [Streptomyces lunaelactis]NUL02562.1 hypothetical protein [Streptomyces lunaelactis]